MLTLYDKNMKQADVDFVRNGLKDKKVVLFGASTRNDIIIKEILKDIKIEFICDSNPDKWGKKFEGIDIVSLDKLKCNDVIVFTALYQIEEVKKVLDKNEIKQYYFYNDIDCKYFEYFYKNGRFYNIVDYEKKADISKVKYLHIIPYQKFLEPFYYMIEENFDMSEHFFIVDVCMRKDLYSLWDFIEEKNAVNNNIHILGDAVNVNTNEMAEYLRLMFEKTDVILLHSAAFGEKLGKNLSKLVEAYYNKMSWFCWGAESYWRKDFFIVRELLSKVKIGFAFYGSLELLRNLEIKNLVGCNVTYSYISTKWKAALLKRCPRNDGIIKILVGHCAYDYCAHEEAFSKLSRFKNENIEIYCPLSYGEEGYAQRIEKLGFEYFGNKFIPLKKYISMGEYYKLLKDIDIAVMPLKLQAAGTTLKILSYLGKKIYLRKEIGQAFEKADIKSISFEGIDNINFKEFIDSKDFEMDTDKVKKFLGCENVVNGWRVLFELAQRNLNETDFNNENLFMDIYNVKMKEGESFDTI